MQTQHHKPELTLLPLLDKQFLNYKVTAPTDTQMHVGRTIYNNEFGSKTR